VFFFFFFFQMSNNFNELKKDAIDSKFQTFKSIWSQTKLIGRQRRGINFAQRCNTSSENELQKRKEKKNCITPRMNRRTELQMFVSRNKKFVFLVGTRMMRSGRRGARALTK